MRRLESLLLGVALLSGPTGKARDHVPSGAAPVADEEHQAGAGRFRRKGDALVIPLPKGGAVTLQDAPEAKVGTDPSGDYRRYRYVEFLPAIGQHLVRYVAYEVEGYLLIDAGSGAKTDFWGLPVPSPSGRFVACAAAVMPADVARVEVWERAQGRWSRTWSLDVPWVPGEPRWRSDDEVEFPGSGSPPAMFRRDGDTWLAGPSP